MVSKICPNWFKGIVDSDSEKHGNVINGLKVYSLHEAMHNYPNSVLVIPNKHGVEKIESELIDQGIARKNILNLGERITAFNEAQYFELEELKPQENEVFVDCGAFDGD